MIEDEKLVLLVQAVTGDTREAFRSAMIDFVSGKAPVPKGADSLAAERAQQRADALTRIGNLAGVTVSEAEFSEFLDRLHAAVDATRRI